MNNFRVSCITGLIAALWLTAGPAQAQLGRTYVSIGGNNANSCNLANPCKSLQTAFNTTNAGGEIDCLDSGDFGSVLINKSITIDCAGSLAGDSSTPFVFQINAPGALVRLRNLSMNGLNGFGAVGVEILSAASVFVENCTILGFRISPAVGIKFTPSASARLTVSDSVVSSNTTGILLDPAAGALGIVMVQRTTIEGNSAEGIKATGAGGGGVFVNVRDSISTHNGSHGFTAETQPGGSNVIMRIDRSDSSYNSGDGVRASGSPTVFLGFTTVMANDGTGLSRQNGGTIFSYGTNTVLFNAADGTPTAVIGMQ